MLKDSDVLSSVCPCDKPLHQMGCCIGIRKYLLSIRTLSDKQRHWKMDREQQVVIAD